MTGNESNVLINFRSISLKLSLYLFKTINHLFKTTTVHCERNSCETTLDIEQKLA